MSEVQSHQTMDYNYNIQGKNVQAKSCNCTRPNSAICCTKCGHVFTGRMRLRCPSHPKVIHLMDSTNCPSCLSNALKEYGID